MILSHGVHGGMDEVSVKSTDFCEGISIGAYTKEESVKVSRWAGVKVSR